MELPMCPEWNFGTLIAVIVGIMTALAVALGQ